MMVILHYRITKLPIIAKGIIRGDDAVRAVKAGCAAILVSNHGARQLDGVPATVYLFFLYITGFAHGQFENEI